MSEFQNNPILDQEFPEFENLEFTSVSSKYMRVVMFNTFIVSAIIFTATAGSIIYAAKGLPTTVNYISVATVVLLIVSLFVYQYFAFFQRKYAVREKDIVYHFGLIQRNIVIIPFNRIQHSTLEEGWISRMLGLKSVSFFTAGSQGADLQINGLPKETAERLNQFVINKIEEEVDLEVENQALSNMKQDVDYSDNHKFPGENYNGE